MPLYRQVYRVLEIRGLLPGRGRQKASVEGLPEGNASLPVPDQFRNALKPALAQFTDDSAFLRLVSNPGNKAAFDFMNLQVERALFVLLDENTKLLAGLSAEDEIEFRGQGTGSLVYLALNHALWNATSREYSYLGLVGVDLDRARTSILGQIDFTRAEREKFKWILNGTAFTLGAIAIIGSDGLALPFLGAAEAAVEGAEGVGAASSASTAFSVSRLGVGVAMLPAVVAAGLTHYDSSESATFERELFYGTSSWAEGSGQYLRMGSFKAVVDTADIEKSDWKRLIISAVLLGLDYPLIDSIVRARPLIALGETIREALPLEQMGKVGQALLTLGPRIKTMGKLGEGLYLVTIGILRIGQGVVETMVPLARAISLAAARLRIPVEDAWMLFEEYPIVGSIAKVTRGAGRQLVESFPNFKGVNISPQIAYRMIRDAAITFGVEIKAEAEAMEDPENNKTRIMINAVASAIGTAGITFVIQGGAGMAEEGQGIKTAFSPGAGTLRERLVLYHKSGLKLFWWGFLPFTVANLGMQVLPAAIHRDSELKQITVESLTNGLVGGLSFYLSSNLRGQVLGELQRRFDNIELVRTGQQPASALGADEIFLARLFRDFKTGEIFMGNASFINNTTGAYVYGAAFQQIPEILGVKREPHSDLGFLAQQTPSGADIDERKAAAFVFDFLSTEPRNRISTMPEVNFAPAPELQQALHDSGLVAMLDATSRAQTPAAAPQPAGPASAVKLTIRPPAPPPPVRATPPPPRKAKKAVPKARTAAPPKKSLKKAQRVL